MISPGNNHPDDDNPEDNHPIVAFFAGFFEVLGINVLILLTVPLFWVAVRFLELFGYIAIVIIFALGLIQLIYVIPRVIWLHRHGRWSKMKGVITAAIIVLLVNGSCSFLIRDIWRIIR